MNAGTILGLSLLFFLIAALYGSAGFGGGSSYLAVLVFFIDDFMTLRTMALLCNITVVSFSLIAAWKAGMLRKKLAVRFLPLLLVSSPFAFFAGQYAVGQPVFFLVLGCALIASAIAMFLTVKTPQELHNETSSRHSIRRWDLPVSAFLGGLAGLVGIGGGIFLAPYLYLSNWDKARAISIFTAVFIWINSLAGLLGYLQGGTLTPSLNVLWPLMLAVFLGGQLGIRLNLKRFSHRRIRGVTAVVILLAGWNVLRKYTWT
jgi:uncharacterized membrane protein YfcA